MDDHQKNHFMAKNHHNNHHTPHHTENHKGSLVTLKDHHHHPSTMGEAHHSFHNRLPIHGGEVLPTGLQAARDRLQQVLRVQPRQARGTEVSAGPALESRRE